MKLARPLAYVAIAASIVVTGCAGTSDMTNSLLGLATGNPQLSQFAALAQSAGLGDMLSGKNPITIFAPSNEAFKKLSPEALAAFQKPENQAKTANILKNHMLPGALSTEDLKAGATANAIGGSLEVAKDEAGKVSVAGANVVESLKGTNGYIHVIDQVLIPN